MLVFTRQRPWFALILARKTVSAAHRCNRTMTCRSALDTDAACGRQPLLYSAPSLLESSWWPAVPRIRLLPRHQIQPSRSLARADDHGQRPWGELGVFEVSCHTGKGSRPRAGPAPGRPSRSIPGWCPWGRGW